MIRNAALLILLLNGVYFFWHIRQVQTPASMQPKNTAPAIVLWREMPEANVKQPPMAWPTNPFFTEELRQAAQPPTTEEQPETPASLPARDEPPATPVVNADKLPVATGTTMMIPDTHPPLAEAQPEPFQSPELQAYDNNAGSDAEVVPAAANSCYQIGPVKTAQAIAAWRDAVGLLPEQVATVSREQAVVTAYMVYLPKEATFAASLANVEKLKAKRISDYWIFRTGEQKGDISLGLFAEKSRAEKLYQQLREQDLQVSLRPRTRNEQVYFGYVRFSAEQMSAMADQIAAKSVKQPEFSTVDSQYCQP
ncbi:MAG: hypothetical protein RQ715_10500 [Methylococcales bacterium]|nr:hypothetical protein [Methylococcales bacterium]